MSEAPPDEPSTPFLIAALEHDEGVMRVNAAKTLGRRVDEGETIAPALVPVLADSDPMVRSMAASALGRLGRIEDGVVEGLLRLLEDPLPPVRFWGADALERLAVDTPEVRAALASLGADADPLAKAAAAVARRALRRLERT